MKIAYTTTFNAEDVHNWSGTPYHMSQALKEAGASVHYIGDLSRQLPPFFKLKQHYNQFFCNQRLSPRFNITAAKHYSQQVAEQLKNVDVDAIVSPLINPIAYLDTDKPLILWTDAVYASLIGFYPPFAYHSAKTIQEGNAITKACLDRVTYAVFSSDWAARAAIEIYGVSKHKVKVIPFGANLSSSPSAADVAAAITKRDAHKIKLLFLAKSWERKGGDTVVAVAKALHEANYPVELHIVGYDHIPGQSVVPPYVHCHGFISKHNPEANLKLQTLLSESHFLFVPSRAEAYGIVFCEANAFGVPCLTTHVGGIGTVIEDGKNGFTFGLDARVQDYVEVIARCMQDRAGYQTLAENSYQAFTTRLNWGSAVNQLMKLI
jgi:glycosyltransferase involved in cell wall biosynthesis